MGCYLGFVFSFSGISRSAVKRNVGRSVDIMWLPVELPPRHLEGGTAEIRFVLCYGVRVLSSEPPRGDSSATESRFATSWVIASPQRKRPLKSESCGGQFLISAVW